MEKSHTRKTRTNSEPLRIPITRKVEIGELVLDTGGLHPVTAGIHIIADSIQHDFGLDIPVNGEYGFTIPGMETVTVNIEAQR